jgi:hypothetical protein
MHTSVIDAAGAIYVIGGHSAAGYLSDVWVSADGGADRTRWCECATVLCGHSRGTGGTGGIYSSAATGGRTRALWALVIRRSPAWPQVCRGRAVPPARRGVREVITRP